MLYQLVRPTSPQINTRDPRPTIVTTYNGVASLGAQFGGFRFCRPHTQKQMQANVFTIFALRGFL